MALRKKKVLIIEDQESMLLVEQQIVRLAGYDTIAASNGDDGLAIARNHPVRLILLDIMMPGKNGFEVLEELRGDPKTRDIPVVVITALRGAEDKDTSVMTGAATILTKPVPKEDLQSVLRKYLGPTTEQSD